MQSPLNEIDQPSVHAFTLGERPSRRTLAGVALVFTGAIVLGTAR